MRSLCLYFQVHQPFRFRKYRFFEIGNEHYYYDDYLNESIIRKVAEKSYLPANEVMLDLIKKYDGKFKIAFSISGIVLEQFELYAPEVLDSFRKLARTGHVEFLAETYAHSLVSLKGKDYFTRQVNQHKEKMVQLFGQEPAVFRNTELIYSDEIGRMVNEMGFKAMLTEGAKHILGWRSPNYLYHNSQVPDLKILLKNFKLSDDIAFRFSNKSWADYPLTTDKYAGWLKEIDKKEQVVNLFMDYETFGEHQWADTGIFEFLRYLPKAVFENTDFTFNTPSEISDRLKPVGPVEIPHPISWADEERDLTAWLGNPLQEQAFNKLYSLAEKVQKVNDPKIQKDFSYLQVSDHFYYMATKFLSDGEVHSYFTPYDSPYEAFINYMNVLSDFEIRVNSLVKDEPKDDEVIRLSKIIESKNETIRKYEDMLLSNATDVKRSASTLQTKGVKKAAGNKKSKDKTTTAKRGGALKRSATKSSAKKTAGAKKTATAGKKTATTKSKSKSGSTETKKRTTKKRQT
jgi:alpha-amylase